MRAPRNAASKRSCVSFCCRNRPVSDPAYLKTFKALIRTNPHHSGFACYGKREFYSDSPRAMIILSAAIAELAVADAIQRFMKPNSETKELFDFDAPIGTFSAKVSVAFALNIFGATTKHDLDLIRALRNGFAHTRHPLAFTTPAVAGVCEHLRLPDCAEARTPSAYYRLTPDLDAAVDKKHPKTRYLTSCHTIAVWLFEFGESPRHEALPTLPYLP